MRRGEAGRLIRDSSLSSTEKLVMLALLDRADNDDCAIPPWRSPSLLAVEKDTSLAHSTVLKTVAHLELHGWLQRSGSQRGQLAGTKRSGRGRSATKWTLIPGATPAACNCPKPDRPSRGLSRKPDRPVSDHPDWSAGTPETAGHDPDCTKGGREGGKVGGLTWDEDSIGAEVNAS